MLNHLQIKTIRRTTIAHESRLPLVFSALADANRFTIFKLLLDRQDLCVSDIANIVAISVPAASQQLKFLELAGLVKRQRNGQMICYEARSRDPLIRSIIKVLQVNTMS
ncbi:winged helix-turn-helix transcriptional regulator [Candidatus Berkelbacteria bacterium]|nr:winged helix-turn-helix transcriptional regulator [Candidatus Berkelbacteria bacterium]